MPRKSNGYVEQSRNACVSLEDGGGRNKESEKSGHVRMDVLLRPEDPPEDYGRRESKGHHSTKAIRNVLLRWAQHY